MVSVLLVILLAHYGWSANPLDGKQDINSSPERDIDTNFGDIKLTKGQKIGIARGEDMSGPSFGFAATNKVARWTNGVIPYEIDCSLENMPSALKSIQEAISEWENKTCLRFPKRNGEKNYLRFFRDTHCWGNVGMIGGRAQISVGDACDYKHVMVHEIGHVVGFFHEQNRKDRDDYVEIKWGNIAQFKDAFDIVKDTDSLGVTYDYESIMHYPWTAFSSNGQPTMKAKKPLNGKVPYVKLSSADVRQTHLMYSNCRTRGRRAVIESEEKQDVHSTQKRSDCSDNDNQCSSWVPDRCSTDDYVKTNCKKSCGICSTTGGSCQDKSTSCPGYAKAGYCQTDDWTKKNCLKSCGKCGTTTGGDCKDKSTSCPGYAKAGYCQTDDWTKKNCLKSCGKCGTTTGGDCKDKSTSCPGYAKAGYCQTDDWTKKNCLKSCGKCGSGGKCADKATRSNCAIWYHGELCKADTYTREHCKKTCGLCGSDTLVQKHGTKLGYGKLCLDYEGLCKSWATSGECTRNPDFMKRTCHVSCASYTRCDRTPPRPTGSCNQPVGIGLDMSGKSKLSDYSLTSSSAMTSGSWDYSAKNARLYKVDDQTNKRVGAWCATEKDRYTAWLQVNLGRRMSIKHIATQGRHKYFERVEKYEVSYSDDGHNFKKYTENGKDVIFNGNCDHFTPVVNTFKETIVARYIRVHPLISNYPCMRLELYGC